MNSGPAKPTVLLLSGPVGVGKTTVAGELGDALETRGISNTVVDLDGLRWSYPRPARDPWNNDLGLENLRAIWGNAFRRGIRNLIVATVVETEEFVAAVQDALGEVTIRTCQLSATRETLIERVERREIGSGRDWHVARAQELAGQLAGNHTPADLRVATDARDVIDIARELADRIPWYASGDAHVWAFGEGLLHHVSLPVRDLPVARRFYDETLATLGYACVFADTTAIGYGVEAGRDKLSLKKVVERDAIAAGFHLAFSAPSRAAVDRFHALALAHGGRDNGNPGLRLAYGPHYYAAFVLDPDGHHLEAVFKDPPATAVA